MKKYIVLSVNDNPDYLYFTPLTCWAWRKMGWVPIIMYNGLAPSESELINGFDGLKFDKSPNEIGWAAWFPVKKIEGYRSDTITQISRLYAAAKYNGDDNCYLMTGDIDMIPLMDYWHGDFNEITVWGHDLTGYTHYPICYIGMPHTRWVEVMGLNSDDHNALIKRDLDTLPQAKDPDFYKYWFSDQDLITKRIKETQFPVTTINRGQYKNGYALGRVDRGAWTLDHKQFIDAHLFHQIYHKGREEYFDKTLDLLYKIWPEEDWGWFVGYTHKFRKLCGIQ
jgi:hypothetical protein